MLAVGVEFGSPVVAVLLPLILPSDRYVVVVVRVTAPDVSEMTVGASR